MQPVFFISLFSLIFLMFSSMTAGLSKNIMQANIERTAKTYEIFKDVETAITKLAFKSKDTSGFSIVDLSNDDLTNLNGTFLAKHTSYTNRELQYDPWKGKVFLLSNVKQEKIWGSSGGQYAQAPVTTFLLVSAGPNKVYDLFNSLGLNLENPNPTEQQILTTDITDENIVHDDIIVRFSNYDSLLEIWQRVEDLDNTVKTISLNYYKNLLDAFSPLIQLSQRDVVKGDLKEDIFDNFDSSDDYDPFLDLKNIANKDFVNKWNDPDEAINIPLNGGTDSGGKIYDGFRVAKAYQNEFLLAAPDYSDLDINDPDYAIDYAKITADADNLNILLNNNFKNEYPEDFLYPSYDLIIKNRFGATLAPEEQGLQNLGITNITSLDPFSGPSGAFQDGMLDYVYDEDEPNKVTIKRHIDSGNVKKWKINKLVEIDGLGDI